MYTRRRFLTSTAIAAAAGIGLAACRDPAQASQAEPTVAAPQLAGPLNTRPIPSTGEKLPVIGMGTSGSFEVGDSAQERDPLREVLTVSYTHLTLPTNREV